MDANTTDKEVAEALDKTQAQLVLNHLIEKTRAIIQETQTVQETARRIEEVLLTLRNQQGQQDYIDKAIKKTQSQ